MKKKKRAKPAKAKAVKAAAPKVKKEPAFSFVIEELMNSRIAKRLTVKPMFGAHAIYRDDQILFILRHRDDKTTAHDNGMWVVSSGVEVERLLSDFPTLRAIKMFQEKKKDGGGLGTWINLPETSPTFESDAGALAQLAIDMDPRVGKVPGTKKKRE